MKEYRADRDGERLDVFLARMDETLSRSYIQRLISDGRVTVGGGAAKASYRLSADETVTADVPEPEATDVEPEAIPLDILYEDEDVVAVNKPAGVPTQPVRAGERGTLSQAMLLRWPELSWGGADGAGAVLHRLDIGTSGVVLAARHRDAWQALRAQFRAQTVEKHYWAVVEGRAEAGESRLPLTHAQRSPCRMRVVGIDARGRLDARDDILPAATRWTPLRTGPDWTWLDVCIRSGVTHQIRCHLSSAGHPLLGDALYGGHGEDGCFYLHSRSITWRGTDGHPRLVLAEPPPEFWARVGGQ